MGADVRRTGRRVPRRPWSCCRRRRRGGRRRARWGWARYAGGCRRGTRHLLRPSPPALTGGGGHSCVITTSGARTGRSAAGVQLERAARPRRRGHLGDAAGEMGSYLSRDPVGLGTYRHDRLAGFPTRARSSTTPASSAGGQRERLAGLGDTNDRGDAPARWAATSPAVDLGTGRTATAVAAGYAHTCAILDDATVRCWGRQRQRTARPRRHQRPRDAAGEMGGNLPRCPWERPHRHRPDRGRRAHARSWTPGGSSAGATT